MTQEPKLPLTEAEWHGLLGLIYKHAEPTLRERGLIAPEPDREKEEARRLAYEARSVVKGFKEAVEETDYDFRLALAALRRGMEIAGANYNSEEF